MNRRKRRAASNLSGSQWEGTVSLWAGHCKIQVLPPNIIIDILSRLPIKTILICKLVCKAWLTLISHPRFVELHLSRSPTTILIKTIPSISDSRKIILTHVDQRGRDPFRLDKLMLTSKSNIPCSKFSLVNSCNGLLCLSGVAKDDPIWVCNPILGEYVTVPPAGEGRNWGSFIGLGFCPATNRYKILQTFHPKVKWSGNDYLDAEIYHMDTGTWKSIGYAPCALVVSSFNSFLRGSLHWVPSAGNSSEYIYSFNFETEQFGSVAPPPCLDGTKREISDYLKLGIVEGCLFICVFGDSRKFDIWVMKDYGVKESWTKQFVIENLYPRQSRSSSDFYEPVKFMSNGEILMLYNDSEVVCYNTQTKRLRRTRVTHTRHEFNSIAHTPSMVSLYNVAKRELVQRLRSSKECVKSSAEGIVDCASFGTLPNEPSRFNSTLIHVAEAEPLQRVAGGRKSAKMSAEGTTGCASFGTSTTATARFDSNPYNGHQVLYQYQNPDQRTEIMSTTNAECFGRIAAQGFSTPLINDVSSNLASKKSLPPSFWQWQLRK